MLVLFDIDGTLVHAAGAGRAAIEGALTAVYGTVGPIEDLRFDGLTDPRIVYTLLRAAGLAEAAIADRIDDLWEAYADRLPAELHDRRASLERTPGVPQILDALESREATLGLVTGNIAAGADRKLTACGLGGRFEFGAFGSDSGDRNELPPIAVERAFVRTGTRFGAHETWIIGDTPRDIDCAHASGLRALAVATGSFSVGELRDAGADCALSSLEDTEAVIEILTTPGRAEQR